MSDGESFRWWDVSPAQNLEPKRYICPRCDLQLEATRDTPTTTASRRPAAAQEQAALARRAQPAAPRGVVGL